MDEKFVINDAEEMTKVAYEKPEVTELGKVSDITKEDVSGSLYYE